MILLFTWMFFFAETVFAESVEAGGIKKWEQAASRSNYCPQWSPDGARIVFYSHIQDRWKMILMKADGSEWKILSSGSSDDFYPTFSPDGGRILFYSNRDGNQEIYIMNADGTEARRLTSNPLKDRYPRFSPDGKRIAFVRADENGKGSVLIMNADGTGERSLTGSSGNAISRLSWSPDSSQILFYQSNDGKDMSGENQWTLYSVDAANGTVRRMHEGWSRDSNPDWSSKAAMITFDAHRTGSWESDDGGWEIFVSKPNGTQRRNVTGNNGINDWGPAWSPDGKKIAYCSGKEDRYEIYVIDADGKNATRLTFNVQNQK